MDFLRPRAIPALIALALLPVPALAACDGLAGTYRYFSVGKDRDALLNYVDGPGKRKLFKYVGGTPQGAGDLASTAPRQRLKVEHLAATVAVEPRADGAILEFFDAAGASLGRVPLAPGYRCNGERLERSEERLAGLGDQVKEMRVEESFARGEGGELVHRTRESDLEGKGKPRESESRFARAP